MANKTAAVNYNGQWAQIQSSDTLACQTLAVAGGGTFGGQLSVTSNVVSSQNFLSSSTVAILAPSGAGSVILRPNGAGSGTGQATLDSAGVFSLPTFYASSSMQAPIMVCLPGAAPGALADGYIWYDSTAAKFRKRENGVTSDLGAVSGTGTVTTMSIATANGISGSVATPTTTPVVTLTLGAITPYTVVTTGAIVAGGSVTTNTTLYSTSPQLTLESSGDLVTGGMWLNPRSGMLGVYISPDNGITGKTETAGNNSTQLATTAYVRAAISAASYRVVLDSSGSHIAARVAGTYWLGQGVAAGITGTGTLYPANVIYIDPADYPTVDGLAAKLRLRAVVNANDVAPGGSYTFGLYPVTRPATSGGAGLCIYTMGTVVTGSTVAVTPAADSQNNVVGSDFAVPTAGFYVIGFVTSATVATSAHVHISAFLQQRNN